ncbi:DNA polymerase III subunit gamma/tau [Rhizobium sp. SSA_523]|uniref:DNA polymerase III subunit gamma/tau n=1 Tax=Rhizobium sp. SSA_523 TaxID=2952477 RepID=UPI00209005E3|nr:DNA polymerase III subunit gamma/tau [Rhizobium sp. SSA_523]MCO5732902.1 DNA polymerase III subunit gamma/tau [Rhizobium sp. SSA_523]WKC23482.1 DNA polymerase III subunit gamma/tau [Rhizobium sp. SSA_523]
MSDTGLTVTGTNPVGSAGGYLVLARKYRPKDFSDLMVGQEPMVRTLTNAFETGRIAQAYMLTGVRGVGKTTTARILARALNYKTDEIDRPSIDIRVPGEHCQAIMEGRHVDVIEMDAASHTGIDDIREIIEQVRYRPVSARYKVYIIDEVHMLSTQAFNGLLKTLEEPPEHVKFIFATTEIRKVPITVLSRCQRFDLRRISAADLVGLFATLLGRESISFEPEALSMIARAAEGSARDGLSLLDQAIAHGGGSVQAETVRSMLGLADRARIVDLFGHVVRGDVQAALREFSQQYDAGANPVVVLTDLAEFTHLVTRIKYIPEASDDPSLSEVERVQGAEFAGKVAVTTLSRLWQMLLKGIPEAENSSRPAGAAEMVLIRLAHAAHLPSPEDAARRVAELMAGGAEGVSGTSSSANGGARGALSGPSAARSSNPAAAPSPGLEGRASDPAPAQRMGAASGGPTVMLAAVPSAPQPMAMGHAETSPARQPAAAAAPKAAITSLSDIADLCTKHRDPKLRALLRNFVRLVKLEPGRLEINLPPDAPKSIVGDLQRRLEEWTEIRWMVILSRDKGERTLAEVENQAREARLIDAKADPDVAAILSHFPGARVTDVRIKVSEEDDSEALAPPTTIETDEGDILPGDDIDL